MISTGKLKLRPRPCSLNRWGWLQRPWRWRARCSLLDISWQVNIVWSIASDNSNLVTNLERCRLLITSRQHIIQHKTEKVPKTWAAHSSSSSTKTSSETSHAHDLPHLAPYTNSQFLSICPFTFPYSFRLFRLLHLEPCNALQCLGFLRQLQKPKVAIRVRWSKRRHHLRWSNVWFQGDLTWPKATVSAAGCEEQLSLEALLGNATGCRTSMALPGNTVDIPCISRAMPDWKISMKCGCCITLPFGSPSVRCFSGWEQTRSNMKVKMRCQKTNIPQYSRIDPTSIFTHFLCTGFLIPCDWRWLKTKTHRRISHFSSQSRGQGFKEQFFIARTRKSET